MPHHEQAVVLASASPRRRELLEAAGIAFEVAPSHVPEIRNPGESAEAFVLRMAVVKAEEIAAQRPKETRPIVGADTTVVLNEHVLEKPSSPADAARMLRLLSGRTHAVLTGLCVLDPRTGRRLTEVVRTEVVFVSLTEQEIQEYAATGEPMDKAGAYAIQGRASRFVERIDGCYFNVVGLPVSTLYRLLQQI